MRNARPYNPPAPRHYIEVGRLTQYNQSIVSKYLAVLEPLRYATKLLEGRGASGLHSAASGLHGAIQEVITTFDQLYKQLRLYYRRVVDAI